MNRFPPAVIKYDQILYDLPSVLDIVHDKLCTQAVVSVFFTLHCVHLLKYNIFGTAFLQYLDVNKVGDERHEDHIIAIPTLSGVHFNPPLQLPPLPTVPHENLKEGMRCRKKSKPDIREISLIIL